MRVGQVCVSHPALYRVTRLPEQHCHTLYCPLEREDMMIYTCLHSYTHVRM